MKLDEILLFIGFGIIIAGLPLALFWKSQQTKILQNGGILAMIFLILGFMHTSITKFQEAIILKNDGILITMKYNEDAKYSDQDKQYTFTLSGVCQDRNVDKIISQRALPNKNYEYYCLNQESKTLLQEKGDVESSILIFVFINIGFFLIFGGMIFMIYIWKQHDKYIAKHGEDKSIKIQDLILNKF